MGGDGEEGGVEPLERDLQESGGEERPKKRQGPATSNGKEIPLTSRIAELTDKQLAHCLVYHRFTFELPADYWVNSRTGRTESCTITIKRAERIAKNQYVWGELMAPEAGLGEEIQLAVSGGVRNQNSRWNLRQALIVTFDNPETIADLGLPQQESQRIAAWAKTLEEQPRIRAKRARRMNLGSKQQFTQTMLTVLAASVLADLDDEGEWEDWDPEEDYDNPFEEEAMRTAWRAAVEEENELKALARDDMLEPDPSNRKEAMRHPRFAPFWKEGEDTEMTGLWQKGCFRKWQKKDLLPDDRVFGSRFHYKIKRCTKTGRIKRFKVRLVVQGHLMEESVDYEASFAPVPHGAVGRMLISLAVANSMHLHGVDLTQAFVQADKIEEGVNGRVFIRPPVGSKEYDPDTVLEVRRPLYGIPSSARALHLTLDGFFKSQGFEQAGCEQSVWTRKAGGKYKADIHVSRHIDDTLICCTSLKELEKFKRAFLKRFEGTDEGEVTQYLGCEITRDFKNKTGTLNQKAYVKKMLQKYDMWDVHPVKTPLEPGTRLTKRDCPEKVDPELQAKYRGLVGEVGWLANNTRPDLAFAHNELAKFLHAPGEAHWKAGLRTLAYLRGTTDLGLKWTGHASSTNTLQCFVDSDYAACTDTRRSQTGFAITLNSGPISWKAKRQKNVTLSSCEAEFLAASDAGKEIQYLRGLMESLGYPQQQPTVMWEDNASAIVMSENGTSSARSRHINIREHKLCELVRDKVVKLQKIKGTSNPSDALTKSVPGTLLERHRPFLLGGQTDSPAIAFALKQVYHVPFKDRLNSVAGAYKVAAAA